MDMFKDRYCVFELWETSYQLFVVILICFLQKISFKKRTERLIVSALRSGGVVIFKNN